MVPLCCQAFPEACLPSAPLLSYELTDSLGVIVKSPSVELRAGWKSGSALPSCITLGTYLDLTAILYPRLCKGVKTVSRVLNKMHVKCPAQHLAQDKNQRSIGCYFGDIVSLHLSHGVVSDHSLLEGWCY